MRGKRPEDRRKGWRSEAGNGEGEEREKERERKRKEKEGEKEKKEIAERPKPKTEPKTKYSHLIDLKLHSMKKTLFMAVFAALVSLPMLAWGQKTIYFNDDFASGLTSTNWNIPASSEIASAGGPAYVVQFSQPSMVAVGWCYDPGADFIGDQYGRPVATTPLEGTYILVSHAHTLDSGVDNMVTFDYIAYAAAAGANRNFGLMVRETGGEWDTIYRLCGEGEAMPAEGEGSPAVKLPDTYGGKTVELAFFFTVSNQPEGSWYAFFIGNVMFASYYTEPTVVPSIAVGRFEYENFGKKVRLNLRNGGSTTITEGSFSYSLNGGEAVDAGNLVRSSLAMGASLTADIALSGDLTEGMNVLAVWPTSLNEAPVADPDTIYWHFSTDTAAASAYVPVMEVFSASWCKPCNTMNRYLNDALKTLYLEGKISPVKFQQSGDRYAIAIGNDRYMYYYDMARGVIPAPIYNAEANITDWTNQYVGMMTRLKTEAAEAHARKAMAGMELVNVVVDSAAREISFEVHVTPLADMRLNLVPVVTEGTVSKYTGSNGETAFHWVALAAPAGSYGEEVQLTAGETSVFSYKVDMTSTLVEEYADLEVMCFLQDVATREIYNSCTFDVREDENVSTEKDELADVRLYPNPARGYFHVSGLENAQIEIFDLMGRKVYGQEKAGGDVTISTDGFEAGAYVVRISQDGKVSVRKITVVK